MGDRALFRRENPTRVRLITALDETLKAVQAEYDYVVQQQKYYQAQAEQVAAETGQKKQLQSRSYYSQFRSWASAEIKDFFGSTPEQQAQKYAEIAESRQTKIDQLSLSLQALTVESDQEVFVAVVEDDCGTPVISNSICNAPLGRLELFDLVSPQGLVINGAASNDFSGCSVSGVGDVNGDGMNDFVIGAFSANGKNIGASYVIFGSLMSVNVGTIELSNLTSPVGLVINGAATPDNSGSSVSGEGDEMEWPNDLNNRGSLGYAQWQN